MEKSCDQKVSKIILILITLETLLDFVLWLLMSDLLVHIVYIVIVMIISHAVELDILFLNR